MNFWKNTPATNENRKFRPKPFCSPSPLQSKDIFPRLFRDVHCPSWTSVRTTDFTTPQKNPVFGAILGLFKICRVSGRKSHMWCSDLYEGDLYSKKKSTYPRNCSNSWVLVPLGVLAYDPQNWHFDTFQFWTYFQHSTETSSSFQNKMRGCLEIVMLPENTLEKIWSP